MLLLFTVLSMLSKRMRYDGARDGLLDGDGVGLGLAISSGIVKDHGGRLTARNSEQGGAVFEMQLPAFGENLIDYSHMEVAE